MNFFLLLLLVGVSGSLAAYRNSDGELRLIDACTIKPYEAPCSFASNGFPSSAPHLLYQVGKFSCYAKSTESAALKITCPIIDIPKSSDGKCEFPLEIEEGRRSDRPREFCGVHKDVSFITKLEDATIRLETGKLGGGRVNCSVECVFIGSDGREAATTVSPFLIDDFVEEDSNEHGVDPGAKGTTCPCGNANRFTQRIVNGTITSPNQYPFIATVVEREDLFAFCGGPIISAYHVLTAAHCTTGPLMNDIPLAVRVGAHDLNKKPGPQELINVERIVMHSDYQPTKYFKNDIALLILEKEIKFSPTVSRVCLPTKQLSFENESVKIIGWGALEKDGEGSTVLREVNVKSIPLEQCKIKYFLLETKWPTQLCTYRKSKGSCQGDSGGPVVWLDPETNRYTLAGLVSFGKICGDTNPTVHTNVGAYLDWIKRYVRLSKPSEMCSKL